MIEKHNFLFSDFQRELPKELMLLSIISQSFFQPFSVEDNLLVIMTALTSGSGIGFNRAMLLLREGEKLKGEMWLGPRSPEEAKSVWEILSTPGIGYIEIIEHNRSLINKNEDTLSRRIKNLSYPLDEAPLLIPALSASTKEIMVVKDARNDPAVDSKFIDIIGVDEFLCVPLIARNEIMGQIVLDNAFTRAPIETQAVRLAGLCGLIAANYVYSTSLHTKLIEMEKMAALGEMASFVTHQLRNPLVTIGGFTEQLLNSEHDASKCRRNLQIIRDEIGRLEHVIYEIGHFLKNSFKQPVPFEVKPVLESVLSRPDIRSKARNVHLQLRTAKCLPQIICDPTYVSEVFQNILDNALDATPAGGEITIRAYPRSKKWFVISVKDTGQGIPDRIRDKLFLPFVTTKEKGIGLGLPFVKRVMDACGGKIEVRSKEGKGTLFKLHFQCQCDIREEGP